MSIDVVRYVLSLVTDLTCMRQTHRMHGGTRQSKVIHQERTAEGKTSSTSSYAVRTSSEMGMDFKSSTARVQPPTS